MVAFGSAKVAVSFARRPFIEGGEGRDKSSGGEGEDWVFDPAVTRLSTRVAVIITQVTLVELGGGEGWCKGDCQVRRGSEPQI